MAEPDDLARLVRNHDPERYFSVLTAPAALRNDLLTLYAFDAEISTIPDRVREPMAGEIRLQWWRDAMDRQESGGHPLAEALVRMAARRMLPAKALLDYLEARSFDLYHDPAPDRTWLEGYCAETDGVMIQLASLILDPEAARASGDMAGHAACALGVTRIMRQTPYHRAQARCYVPAEFLIESGIDSKAWLEQQPGEAADGVMAAMANLAEGHHRSFLTHAGSMPASLRPAYLPLAAIPAHLAALNRKGGGAAASPTQALPWRSRFAMVKRAWSGF